MTISLVIGVLTVACAATLASVIGGASGAVLVLAVAAAMARRAARATLPPEDGPPPADMQLTVDEVRVLSGLPRIGGAPGNALLSAEHTKRARQLAKDGDL